MKLCDLGADAVACKGVFNLAGDVTIDEAEAKQE
jgi:hypothetical protein